MYSVIKYETIETINSLIIYEINISIAAYGTYVGLLSTWEAARIKTNVAVSTVK